MSRASDARAIIDASLNDIKHLETLEPTLVLTPVRYTISGAGYLEEDTAINAMSISINTFPAWAEGGSLWVLIDAGTNECEARKISSVNGINYCFGVELDYAHDADDYVVFVDHPVLSIKYWGAKGDNVTNDWLSISRAFAQVEFCKNATVYIPAGVYKLTAPSTPLTLPEGGKLRGDSMYDSVLNFVAPFIGVCVEMESSTEAINLSIFGPGTVTKCLRIDTRDSVNLWHIYMVGGEDVALEIVSSSNITIRHVRIRNFYYNRPGIYIHGAWSENIICVDNYVQFASNSYAYKLTDINTLLFLNNRVDYLFGSYGYMFENVTNFNIGNNKVIGALHYGYSFSYLNSGVIKGNFAHGCGWGDFESSHLTSVEFGANYWENPGSVGTLGFPTDANRLKFFDREQTTLCALDFSLVRWGLGFHTPVLRALGPAGGAPQAWLMAMDAAVGVYVSPPCKLFGGSQHALYISGEFCFQEVPVGSSSVQVEVSAYSNGVSILGAPIYSQPQWMGGVVYARQNILFGPVVVAFGGMDLLKIVIYYNYTDYPQYDHAIFFIGATLAWD